MLRRNERGIAVPSEENPLPWKPWPRLTPSGIVDANGRWIDTSPETFQFQAHAANYHERLAEIARRSYELSCNHSMPQLDSQLAAVNILDHAAELWKEMREDAGDGRL